MHFVKLTGAQINDLILREDEYKSAVNSEIGFELSLAFDIWRLIFVFADRL